MVEHFPFLTFGPFLRQLRRRAGMTQADLAAAVDYSATFISNLEKEARQPDVETVAKRFVPALALQDEPKLAARLIELAALARGIRPPSSLTIVSNTQMIELEDSDMVQGGIPAAPTPLIGRASDVDWICKRMLGHHGRLMTLLGPPGVGKTRLALETATFLQAIYADGACFVPLDAVEDPALVPLTIAAAVGLENTDAHDPKHQLIMQLRRKEMLLALDNFEHILPAAPLVAELLAACPGLRIIVTSRERLHLRAEQRYRVKPLPVGSAADLFIQAVTAIDPDFALAEGDIPLLHKLCLELDCLPLALELAAAHIDFLDLPTLLERLRVQRLDVLSGGAEDLPQRQQTLRTAIAYSYDRLTPAEETLFRSLGVFAGGFDLEAVLAVGHSQTGVEAMITKNLVQRLAEEDGLRFQLLDTLRAYALEQLSISGDLEVARRRHAQHYLELAEEAERALRGPGQSRWFRRLAREIHNLRAAMRHFLDGGDIQSAARICVSLRHFWTMQSRLEEGRTWLDRILAAGIESIPARLQVKVLNSRGSIAYYQEDYAQTHASFLRAESLAEEVSDYWGMAFALDGLAATAANRSDYAAAIDYSTRSLAVSRAHGFDWLSAITLINLGEVARAQGDVVTASDRYEQSLALLRDIGDDSYTAITLINLAQIALNLGDWSRAKVLAHESLQISSAGGHHLVTASGLDRLAAIAAQEGQVNHAGRLFGAAIALRRRHNITIQPADRSDYERMLAAARNVGDDKLFDEALAAGQTLSLREALDLVADL